MREDSLTLAELMFHADQFCIRVKSLIDDREPVAEEDEELSLKVGQCQNLLAELQRAYDEDQLTIENPSVRANFRFLVMALLWVAFRARRVIDYRLFRRLVLIEAGFNYLLVNR